MKKQLFITGGLGNQMFEYAFFLACRKKGGNSQIVPMHLLALDIMIDIDGSPRLIEFNCNGFGFWYPMFVGLDPFGGKADEVIEYCKQIK